MGNDDLVELDLVYHHRTSAAICVSENGFESEVVWLPLSQIKWDEGNYNRNDDITVFVPEWLAMKKGLV